MSIDKILQQMRREPANIRFSELRKVCENFFGPPRQQGSSHLIFKTPWPGDPRVNIQDAGGKAKPYQVRNEHETNLAIVGANSFALCG